MGKVNKTNQLDYIMAYEDGSLSDDDTVELFQYLVDSGLAWRLQGSYGRTAKALIESGHVKAKEKNHE